MPAPITVALSTATAVSLRLPPAITPSPPIRLLRRGRRRLRLRSVGRAPSASATSSPSAPPTIDGGALWVRGRQTLSEVPENVTLSLPHGAGTVAFLGANADRADCRHVFKLGGLQGFRLLCLFRFKIWWMIPRMGNSACDVPKETQMLLLEVKDEKETNGGGRVPENSLHYVLFLPVLDGLFRSSLQGGSSNELEFCIESGDPSTRASQFLQAIFVNHGDNPFDLIHDSMKFLEQHMGTFFISERKTKPEMLDWFGWCTWDAFYFDVNPLGIMEGLNSLSKGGFPPKFLIIDDGWQDTFNEFQKEGEPSSEGSQYGARLISLEENSKFKDPKCEANGKRKSLRTYVADIKQNFGVKYVYVWHALMGYWGGLNPESDITKKYVSRIIYPVQSPGNLSHLRDLTMDCMEKYGIGVINPEKVFEFYDEYHSYLASQEVDGVKVDVQNILETVGSGYGGRVSLTRRFQQALEESIAKNFKHNDIICCMAHSTDSVYSSKVSAVTRASDDYWPRDESAQTRHIAAVAFNSLFLGEVMVPDWDMFYSLHYAAEFHATARALGGCGIYISDKPNAHDFEILKKLVLPDGSILRAKLPGRPTRDCLFNDPLMDGKSLLKIWNLNECTGVIGIFNCQGAGIWPCTTVKNVSDDPDYNSYSGYLEGHASAADVEYLEEVAGHGWTGDCAVYSFNSGSLTAHAANQTWAVSLKVLQCEVYTISPINENRHKNIRFGPIGLIGMYNSGGAIKSWYFSGDEHQPQITVNGRGSGPFGAYLSRKPQSCTVNLTSLECVFNAADNFLKLIIPPAMVNAWEIQIYF